MKKFIVAFLILLFVIAPAALGLYLWMEIPSDKEIKGCMTTTMYHVHLCPKSPQYVPLKKISPYMLKTVVMTEDSTFWQNQGFDWDSIKRNYEENSKLGYYKRGGSTITQQLAKNMFLTGKKSLIRKGIEALITLRIDQVLTKREVLERYLNVIEFGKNIYGIKAASQHYFQKSPADLNIVESAFLAMLLPNPKKYAASFYKKELTPFASKRITQIIDHLYEYHNINDEEYSEALTQLENFFHPPESVEEGQEAYSTDEDLTLDKLEKATTEEDEENNK